MGDFTKAFTDLMGNEGGLSVGASDPGNWTGGKLNSGELIGTIWGLSAPVLVRHGVLTADAVRAVTQAQAMTIARAEYWDAVRGDELPDPLAFQVFDAAYNSGPSRAIQWLRLSVGLNAVGGLDDAIVTGLRCVLVTPVILRFDAYRLRYLTSLPTWSTFGKGWAKRIADNLLRAAG